MKKILVFVCLMLSVIRLSAYYRAFEEKQDSTTVLNYIAKGFDVRLSDASQTIRYADKAIALAKKLQQHKLIADAYRIKGLGERYLGHNEKAIENYFNALSNYQLAKNSIGEVRIYLNISSLYLEIDHDKCLEYLHDAMDLYNSKGLNNDDILASIYLNYGNVYQLHSNFNKSMAHYQKAYDIISKQGNQELKVTLLQNLGVINFTIGNYDRSRQYLFEALESAKSLDLNLPIAQIDVSLAELYIALNDHVNAEKCLQEGKAYAVLSKNDKLLRLFDVKSYMLELKRKNFEKALTYLQAIHRQDSIQYSSRSSAALSLFQARYKQEMLEQQNKQMKEQRRYQISIAVGSIILAALLIVVVVLLTNNVKRNIATNRKLKLLNAEISTQKDNLDRINHHLEEIIDERTLDLQLKNKKLAEYSSHLSHQIRGPIATLKGLMNLEREGLVSQEECIQMMIKCVSEIDDNIIDMSDMLHNPDRAGL